MHELESLLENLPPADRRALLRRARFLYLARHPWLIAIHGTVAGGLIFLVLALLSLVR